jgi:hypothetical protein
VHLPRRPARRRPARDRPGTRLLRRAGSEEADQVEQRERLAHDRLEARLAGAEVAAHRRRLLVVELGELRVDPGTDSRSARAVALGVRDQLGRRLEQLALGDVGDVEDRLRGQRLQ